MIGWNVYLLQGGGKQNHPHQTRDCTIVESGVGLF